ncbi:serine/threonine protein kinase [Mycoemilia scoparia]|uniref:non-specific serine/threonine protein kinase n=1 Tax=Mycoemilia scoparia TaxID=417184 RepID=A0A9W8DWI7_9FUNG|nr:serine/threonine protein kinase [Mycoemilia scoparia]
MAGHNRSSSNSRSQGLDATNMVSTVFSSGGGIGSTPPQHVDSVGHKIPPALSSLKKQGNSSFSGSTQRRTSVQNEMPAQVSSHSSITTPGIRRTTSISQRLQNLLHIGGSSGNNNVGSNPGSPTAPTKSRSSTYERREPMTIAYQSTMTFSGTNSGDNMGSPTCATPPSYDDEMKPNKTSLGRQPSAYRPSRHFEPVASERLISIDQRYLPSGFPSRSLLGVSETIGGVPGEAREGHHHPYNSRNQANGNVLESSVVENKPSLKSAQPPAKISEAAAAAAAAAIGNDKTLPLPAKTVTKKLQDQTASNTTATNPSGTTPAPSKPSSTVATHQPHYSTHEVALNRFGRTTKVIGKGTGGTVRLLHGVDVNRRPPSIRGGPPSAMGGESESGYIPANHKLFAVKEFRRRRSDETPRAYTKKVTSEFCIGSSIHHENVIETLDLIFEGDRVYEIMEYCPHDLFTFVAMGETGLEETLCWFKQVCQGVAYLHSLGIAHRDLKLENCLLTDTGIVKLIDFGCATVFKTPFQKTLSKVTGICGSDPYIAPEVFNKNEPYSAPTSDVWSVGIMYMCMALLKFPWRIADTKTDRNYASYIRDWPRGRDKLMGQLPDLNHDGLSVIQSMIDPSISNRCTMDDVINSEWVKDIEVCHFNHPAQNHTHNLKVVGAQGSGGSMVT